MTAPSYKAAAAAQQFRVLRAALVALVLVAGACPLLVGAPAPLQDWPNHLARVHILNGLLQGGGGWERFYTVGSFAVPNLALDLGVLGLIRLGLPEAVAGQVFLIATYAVFVGGFVALARRFGPVGPGRVAVGVAVFLCGPLFWGLVNYVFAVGLMMALLAVWLGAGPRGRLAVALLGTGALFLCHLIATVAFVAALGLFELAEIAGAAGPWGRRLRGRVTVSAALAMLAVLMVRAPSDPSSRFGWHEPVTLYSFIRWKAVIFVQWAVNGGTWPVRAVTGAGVLAAAVAAIWARSRPRVAYGALAVVMGWGLIAVVAPEHIGGGSLLDDRLALLPPLLLAAAAQPNLRRPGAAAVASGLLVMLAVARAGTLAAVWLGPAAEFRAYDAMLGRLAPGTMVVMANARALTKVRWPEFWAKPYTSIETQAVFHGDFVPMIFANPAQQPIALRPEFAGMNQPIDVTTAQDIRDASERVRGMCAKGFPGVAITVLYADPDRHFTDPNGASVELYGTLNIRVLDGCRLAGAPTTPRLRPQ